MKRNREVKNMSVCFALLAFHVDVFALLASLLAFYVVLHVSDVGISNRSSISQPFVQCSVVVVLV